MTIHILITLCCSCITPWRGGPKADKTQLGRITQDFDWLGGWFTPAGPPWGPERWKTIVHDVRWTLWAKRMQGHSVDDIELFLPDR